VTVASRSRTNGCISNTVDFNGRKRSSGRHNEILEKRKLIRSL
jgi:hypothetical protein